MLMYALERLTGSVWIRYAQCGKRALLERVRDGLGKPEEWRIVFVPHAYNTLPAYQKTA